MPDEKFKIRSILERTAPVSETPPPDDTEENGLPARNSRHYVPHARPSSKPLYALHFVSPAGSVTSFQYVHLDSHSSYAAECITLQFLGMKPVKVAIHGRNLWRLYDCLHQHRIAWVMQASRDFAEDGETIITEVRFTPVSDD
jgi:hypothetical protein